MAIETRKLKVQQNKGMPRIWMQGKVLDDAGFKARAKYKVDIGADLISLQLDSEGTRAVSGKDKTPEYREPVIDLHQKALTAFVQDATHVEIKLNSDKGVIEIRRAA